MRLVTLAARATAGRSDEKGAAMQLSDLTRPEAEHFRQECNFTETERKVFDLRTAGKSIIEVCMAMSLSESAVNRRIRRIKAKMARV